MAAFVVVLVAAAHASSELVDLGEDTLANAPNLSGDTKLSALKEKVNSLKAENTAAQDKITVLKANAGAWSVEASRSAASSRVAAATAEALERKVAYGRKSMKRRLDTMQRKINLEVEARNQKMKVIPAVVSLSLSLSLTHTHTHTHIAHLICESIKGSVGVMPCPSLPCPLPTLSSVTFPPSLSLIQPSDRRNTVPRWLLQRQN